MAGGCAGVCVVRCEPLGKSEMENRNQGIALHGRRVACSTTALQRGAGLLCGHG